MHKKRIVTAFYRSKFFFALFSLLFSLLLIVGSTYAWQTYSDERLNRTNETAGNLDVEIEEEFQPNLTWAPGTTTQKILTVKNFGKSPAFIRVSLYEYLLYFEVDLLDGEAKGNGSLKVVNTSSGNEIDIQQVDTWGIGNTYLVENGKYIVAKEVFKSNKGVLSTAYQYQGTRGYEPLNYLTIQFKDEKIATAPPEPATRDYWYYENGYFYYSEVLNPGESTEELIQSVHLDSELPNRYKGAFYQLVPVMQAHDQMRTVIQDWNLTGTYMETMYQEKVK